MSAETDLVTTIFAGWTQYQATLIKAVATLTAEQLALRASPRQRPVGVIAAHIIGARARWFMDDGGEAFRSLGRWDRRGARPRSADELVSGLEITLRGIHEAVARFTPEAWQQTWPGEDDSEPEVITRQWIIWHLIEHDLYHGGEISLTLGAHRLRGIAL